MEVGMQTSKDAVMEVASWLLIPAAWVPLFFLMKWALQAPKLSKPRPE
jgi:hypothetical protein